MQTEGCDFSGKNQKNAARRGKRKSKKGIDKEEKSKYNKRAQSRKNGHSAIFIRRSTQVAEEAPLLRG